MTATAPTPAQVERFRASLCRLCEADEPAVLLAISGGADSLALLLLAHAAFGARVRAATVDHGLRAAAAAEAAFVSGACRALGIAHATLTGALPPRVGRTANLSSRARALRYGLLEAHARETGCAHVATAHHAEDQVETLVMRLNRGAGVTGLAGIRARGGAIVRPLLDWRRGELAAIVAGAGLGPVLDPSNTDDRYDRARLRRALAAVDWLDADRWGRSAAAAGDADDALAWVTARLLAEQCERNATGVTLHFDDEPVEIVRRLVIACLLTINPAAAPRAAEVMRLVGALRRLDGRVRATLGGVLVTADPRPASGCRARFELAPPRRIG